MKKRIRVKMPKDGYGLSNDLSKEEQYLWGILLEHAAPEFFSVDEHSMSIKDALYKWSIKCGDLKTDEELVTGTRNIAITVQFSLLTSHKKRSRGSFPLIVCIGGDEENIYYAYSESFKEKCSDACLVLFLEEQGLSCKHVSPYSFASPQVKKDNTPSSYVQPHMYALVR